MQLYNTYNANQYNMSQSLAAFYTNDTLVQFETIEETTFKEEFVSTC